MMVLKLKIDSREHSELAEMVIHNCREINVPYEKEWLDIGDYTFGDVCFEAKSAFDFLQSVINKRLWNQLDNMDAKFMKKQHIDIYKSYVAVWKNYGPTSLLPKVSINECRLLACVHCKTALNICRHVTKQTCRSQNKRTLC